MYNPHKEGKLLMMLRVGSFISIGTLVLTLSSCSLLGERKASTRIDLEEGDGDFKQIRVIAPESSGIKDKKAENKDNNSTNKLAENSVDLPKGTYLDYNVSYRHPQYTDVEKYIKDNDINLWQISGNEDLLRKNGISSAPNTLDTISYFGGLGGTFSGALPMIDPKNPPSNLPEDLQKQVENDDDQMIQEIHSKMVDENAACDNNFSKFKALGKLKINLDKTNVEEILKNTMVSGTQTLKEYIEKKKADAGDTVPVKYYYQLQDSQKESIDGSFDPRASNFEFQIFIELVICNTSNPIVYIVDKNQYEKAKEVKLSEEEDGTKIYQITATRMVSSDYFKQMKATGDGQKIIALNDLTFCLEDPITGESCAKKKPVFNDQQPHEQFTVIIYKVLKGPAPTPENKENSDKQPEKNNQQPNITVPENENSNVPAGLEAAPGDAANENVSPATEGSLTGNKDVSDKTPVLTDKSNKDAKNNTGGGSPTVKDKTPDKPVIIGKENKAASDSVKVKVTTPVTTPDSPDPVIAALIKKFSHQHTLFDPRLLNSARNYYNAKNEYDAGPNNNLSSNYWKPNNGYYVNTSIHASKLVAPSEKQLGYYTDTEVNSACGGYQFQRTLQIKTQLGAPASGKNIYMAGKTYAKVLADQIGGDVDTSAAEPPKPKDDGKEKSNWEKIKGAVSDATEAAKKAALDAAAAAMRSDILDMIVSSALSIPTNLQTQTWDIKICFDDKNGSVTFWASDELKNTYKYTKSKYRKDKEYPISISAVSKERKWLMGSTISEGRLSTPSIFNKARKGYPPTLLTVRCLKNNPKDCAVIFQLGIKRAFEANRIMAYLDLNKIKGMARGDILDGLNEGFTNTTVKDKNGKVISIEPKTNRLSVFVYGGFKLDAAKGNTPVDYLSPKELISAGYIHPDPIPPAQLGDTFGKYENNVTGTITFDGAMTEYYLNAIEIPFA